MEGAMSLLNGYQYAVKNKKISIFDVAGYFLALTKEVGSNMTTVLELQKLCFYTRAWSLVWDHKPLFDEDFEQGKYGPANRDLFEKYRSYGLRPILEPDPNFDPDVFTDKQKDMMDAVWNAYSIHGARHADDSKK